MPPPFAWSCHQLGTLLMENILTQHAGPAGPSRCALMAAPSPGAEQLWLLPAPFLPIEATRPSVPGHIHLGVGTSPGMETPPPCWAADAVLAHGTARSVPQCHTLRYAPKHRGGGGGRQSAPRIALNRALLTASRASSVKVFAWQQGGSAAEQSETGLCCLGWGWLHSSQHEGSNGTPASLGTAGKICFPFYVKRVFQVGTASRPAVPIPKALPHSPAPARQLHTACPRAQEQLWAVQTPLPGTPGYLCRSKVSTRKR